MGTNYYAVRNRPSVCEPIHIGKSSAGWKFHFQQQNNKWNEPPIEWNTFPQVRDWLKKYTVDSTEYVIMDEYDRIVPFDEFMELIERKQEENNPGDFAYARNVDGYRFSEGDFI